MRRLLAWVAGLAALVLIIAGALVIRELRGEDARFYHDDFSDGAAPSVPAGVREVDFETSDHLHLKAWMLGPASPDKTLVLFHGTGATRTQLVPLANALTSRGIGVVLSEYRGYAGLPGRPSDDGLFRDGRAALALARKLSAPGANVFVGGFSLGTVPAVRVAASDRGVRGVVLIGAYTKLADLPLDRRSFPRSLFFHPRFAAQDYIGAVTAPILAIGSPDDQTVPIAVSERLLKKASAQHRLLRIPQRSHVKLVDPVEPAAGAIAKFIDNVSLS